MYLSRPGPGPLHDYSHVVQDHRCHRCVRGRHRSGRVWCRWGWLRDWIWRRWVSCRSELFLRAEVPPKLTLHNWQDEKYVDPTRNQTGDFSKLLEALANPVSLEN